MPGRAGRASRATHAAIHRRPQDRAALRALLAGGRDFRNVSRTSRSASGCNLTLGGRHASFSANCPTSLSEVVSSSGSIRKRAGSAGSTQEAHRKHTRSAGKEEHRAPHSVFRTHAGVHNPGILRFFLMTEVRRRTPARYEPCGPASRRVLHVCAALRRCTVTELGHIT